MHPASKVSKVLAMTILCVIISVTATPASAVVSVEIPLTPVATATPVEAETTASATAIAPNYALILTLHDQWMRAFPRLAVPVPYCFQEKATPADADVVFSARTAAPMLLAATTEPTEPAISATSGDASSASSTSAELTDGQTPVSETPTEANPTEEPSNTEPQEESADPDLTATTEEANAEASTETPAGTPTDISTDASADTPANSPAVTTPNIDYGELMIANALVGNYDAGEANEQARNDKIDALGIEDAYCKVSFHDLMQLGKIITAEAGDERISFDWKAMVGEVLLNRVASPEFPNTLDGCIYAPHQYAAAGTKYFKRLLPPEDCARAAFRLLSGERWLNDPAVVFQAEFRQGSGVAVTLYHPAYGNTYLCYSEHMEYYR